MSQRGNTQLSHEASTEKAPEVRAVDEEMYEREDGAVKLGVTTHDMRDMNALGIAATFRRRFKFVAMVGFSSTVVVAWPNVLTTFGFGLFNGGTGGLFWTFIWSMIAMIFVYLSLAELSSVFPTAAGQYQWVAECAPPSGRKLLAYCTGWLLALGWQTWLTSCGVVIGNIIKYCILIYHPDSAPISTQWFPTLLAIIALVSGGLINIYFIKRFPLLESVMLYFYLAAWIAIVVTLWAASPHGNTNDTLFTFTNGGGWSSTAASVIIGVITTWSSILGYDSSVHMTENTSDASRIIPWSLLTAYAINALLAFILLVTMIFCAGNINEVLAETSLTPFVVIFFNSTRSKAGTVVMILPIILALYSALISQVATASRQLWAFARDDGLPFSTLLAPVYDSEVPRRAVWTTICVTSVLSCINFGPVVGFNAIVSLAVISVTFSYTISIASLIWRRLFGRPIPHGRFSLGRWGLPVNVVALACTAPVTVLSLFPPVPNPIPAYMNWAILVFGYVAIVSAVYYAVSGRKRFNPPIRKEEYL